MGRSRVVVVLALFVGLAVCIGLPAAGATPRPARPRAAPSARAHTSNCVSGPIVFELVEASSRCFVRTASERWESSEAVTFDGVSLSPVSGTQLILTGPSFAAPGGELSVRTDLTVAGVRFAQGLLTWRLPAGRAGDEKTVVSLATPSGQE